MFSLDEIEAASLFIRYTKNFLNKLYPKKTV